MKRILALSVLFLVLAGLAGCGDQKSGTGTTQQPAQSQPAAKKYKIATVVKLTGIDWFNRMEVGVKKFAKDTGNDAYLTGPAKADAALQVQIIEDLIAQKVDAICVVPFSVEALEPVLKRAREQGIVVITHEAANIQNADYDIEAFDNTAYGAHFMDQLAKFTGGKGEYAVFVGSLTSKSHMEWADGSINQGKAKYPDLKLAGGNKVESYDDVNKAYEKSKELLKAFPNLKAIQGSAATDVAGAARAIEEMGLTGKVSIVGTSLVSISKQYLQSGSINSISFWDPMDAGTAMNKVALMLLQGKKADVKVGMDLGVKGYNNMQLNGKVFYGQAWIDVTKANMGDYSF